MTASNPPRSERPSPQCAVLRDRFDRVIRARRIVTTAGRKQGTNKHLVATYNPNQNLAHARSAFGVFEHVAHLDNLRAQLVERQSVRRLGGTNCYVQRPDPRQQLQPHGLAKSSLHAVALHGRMSESRNDQAHPPMQYRGSTHPERKNLRPEQLPLELHSSELGTAAKPICSRESERPLRRWRTWTGASRSAACALSSCGDSAPRVPSESTSACEIRVCECAACCEADM